MDGQIITYPLADRSPANINNTQYVRERECVSASQQRNWKQVSERRAKREERGRREDLLNTTIRASAVLNMATCTLWQFNNISIVSEEACKRSETERRDMVYHWRPTEGVAFEGRGDCSKTHEYISHIRKPCIHMYEHLTHWYLSYLILPTGTYFPLHIHSQT